MIDFYGPPAEKSKDEELFDSLNGQYTERFGEPYVFSIGFDGYTWAETIKSIRRCLETGKRQAKPDYKPGLIY